MKKEKKEHDLLERRGDVVAGIVSSSQKEERSCCRRNQTRRERNEKPNPKLEMSLTERASIFLFFIWSKGLLLYSNRIYKFYFLS